MGQKCRNKRLCAQWLKNWKNYLLFIQMDIKDKKYVRICKNIIALKVQKKLNTFGGFE